MKKILILGSVFLSHWAFSQVIIEDNRGVATDKTNVLLEFSKTENRGLLLPAVRTLPSSPSKGTMLLDGSGNNARVKYYDGSTWVDLSNIKNTTAGDASSVLNTQQPTGTTEKGKVVIGASTSTAEGVIVLESTNKAMILPHVASVNDIINPSPGMIVYTTNTNLLAVFNGTKWSFWKAK